MTRMQMSFKALCIVLTIVLGVSCYSQNSWISTQEQYFAPYDAFYIMTIIEGKH